MENNEKTYLITETQLKSLGENWNRLSFCAEKIETLCQVEMSAMRYGFELGKIYLNLIQCISGISMLTANVHKQQLQDESKYNH